MKSGHGRLILRDGTDVPIGYHLAHDDPRLWCQGTLIGDMRSIDPGSFCKDLRVDLDDGIKMVVLVTAHSDRHISFVGNFVAS